MQEDSGYSSREEEEIEQPGEGGEGPSGTCATEPRRRTHRVQGPAGSPPRAGPIGVRLLPRPLPPTDEPEAMVDATKRGGNAGKGV